MVSGVQNTAKQMKVPRRKLCYAFGFCMFLIAILALLSRYFERSDFLKPVSVIGKKSFAGETIVDNGLSSTKGIRKQNISPWDRWMEQNSNLQSIGDIWDKCDNKTREKIGKIVLEQLGGEGGVRMVMLLNMTFTHKVTGGKILFIVHYKGMVLHEKEYDFCEECRDLENPLSCPFSKGYKVRLRTIVKLPSYIPKGHYVMFSKVKDQDGKEIGCINAEVVTGK